MPSANIFFVFSFVSIVAVLRNNGARPPKKIIVWGGAHMLCAFAFHSIEFILFKNTIVVFNVLNMELNENKNRRMRKNKQTNQNTYRKKVPKKNKGNNVQKSAHTIRTGIMFFHRFFFLKKKTNNNDSLLVYGVTFHDEISDQTTFRAQCNTRCTTKKNNNKKKSTNYNGQNITTRYIRANLCLLMIFDTYAYCIYLVWSYCRYGEIHVCMCVWIVCACTPSMGWF